MKKTSLISKPKDNKWKEGSKIPWSADCPFCHSNNVEWSSEEPGGQIIEYRYCPNCGGAWTDTYILRDRIISELPTR